MSDESRPAKPGAGEPVSTRGGKGPQKGKAAPETRRIRGKLKLKPKLSGDDERAASGRGAPKSAPMEPLRDQKGLKARERAPEGYVRFRVRVDNGEMSIVGSQLVESTLVAPDTVLGNFVYEVTEGEKRLHLGSIPDLGVFRSFANPDGPPEQRRHHTYELSTYEFNVRVPAKDLTSAVLPNVSIALYRVKDARQPMVAGVRPFNVQYARELREVGRVEGIPAGVLPESLRKTAGGAARKGTQKKSVKKRR